MPRAYHVPVTSDADPTRHVEAVIVVHDYKNQITRSPDASDAYDYHTATVLMDGSVLVVGGAGYNGVTGRAIATFRNKGSLSQVHH